MKVALVALAVLGLVGSANAQTTTKRQSTTTRVQKDSSMRQAPASSTTVTTDSGDDVVVEQPAVAASESSTTEQTVTNDSTITAPLPRTMASPVRLIPVAGASSFANSRTLQTNRFGDGFSAGVFADFGQSTWNFETGVLSLSSNTSSTGNNTRSVRVNTWGVPLLAKLNFSGKPHETVFLKAGAMPFVANGQDINDFNVLGVGGIGANIPLGRSSSIILDATYNRLFTQGGDLTDYQGLALLGGLSLNL